jgi:hypothetical protein
MTIIQKAAPHFFHFLNVIIMQFNVTLINTFVLFFLLNCSLSYNLVGGTASLTIPPSYQDPSAPQPSTPTDVVHDDLEGSDTISTLTEEGKNEGNVIVPLLEREVAHPQHMTDSASRSETGAKQSEAGIDDCESRLDECLFYVRTLAESLLDEAEIPTPSSIIAECPACPICEECPICETCMTHDKVPPVVCDFSEKEKSYNELLVLKDSELDTLRAELGDLKELNRELEVTCPADVQESFNSQLQLLSSEISSCRNELTASNERYKELEKSHSTAEIRLKIVKNELHVAKLNNEQQKLSLEAVQLENEAKIESLQKEIGRLNTMLVEARKSARGTNKLSEREDKMPKNTNVPSAIPANVHPQECTISLALSNFLGIGSLNEEESSVEQSTTPTISPQAVPEKTKNNRVDEIAEERNAEKHGGATNNTEKKMSLTVGDHMKSSLFNKIIPTLVDFVLWEYGSAFRLGRMVWSDYLWPVIFKTKDVLHFDYIIDILMQRYQNKVKPKLDSQMNSIQQYLHDNHWDETYEAYLEPYIDFVIDKTHFFAYYGYLVFQGEESPSIMVDYILKLIRSISSLQSIQQIFGSNSVSAVQVGAGLVMVATMYFFRRLLVGLGLATIALSILPVILALFAVLKVMSYFYERKGVRGMKSRRTKSSRRESKH